MRGGHFRWKAKSHLSASTSGSDELGGSQQARFLTDQPAPTSAYPLRSLSVAPPDTHCRFNFNLRCVSGGATEGLRCGAGEIECAGNDGAGISGSGSHEGSDWFDIGHGGSRLRSAGQRTITLVMSVSICGCELYSLCKRHSPFRIGGSFGDATPS